MSSTSDRSNTILIAVVLALLVTYCVVKFGGIDTTPVTGYVGDQYSSLSNWMFDDSVIETETETPDSVAPVTSIEEGEPALES